MSEESTMITAVSRLADALERLTFGPYTDDLADERDRLVDILDSYVRPRLLDPSMTLHVVVAGPTGSGKSTIVNTLAGADVSVTGAIRPTTASPVIVASSANAPIRTVVGGVDCELRFASTPLLEKMHLIDTPDIDSTVVEHRVRAEKMIDEADIVLFVTSAIRYADDVPWQVLRRAMSRGVPLISVLNRVGSANRASIVDFGKRLREAGLSPDVVVVPEHLSQQGVHRLPAVTVAVLVEQLTALHDQMQAESVSRLARVLDAVAIQARELIDSVEETVHDLSASEAELAMEAAARAEAVDFPDLDVELHTPPPGKPHGRHARRWRRHNRVPDAVMSDRRDRVKELVGLEIESDLRTWLAELEAAGRPGHVMTEVRPIVQSAIDGWFVYVQRMVEPLTRRDQHLAECVLIDSTIVGSPSDGARMVFGEEADEMVSRSVRELHGRIGVVYNQAAANLTERRHAHRGHFDTEAVEHAIDGVLTTTGA